MLNNMLNNFDIDEDEWSFNFNVDEDEQSLNFHF